MKLKKILQFSIGPFSSAALGIISIPLLGWFFTPEDIGKLSLLHITIGITTLVCCFGFDQGYIREFYEFENNAVLLKSLSFPGLLILLVLISFTLIFGISISKIAFGIKSLTLDFLVYIAIVSTYINRFLSIQLRVKESAYLLSLSQIIQKVSVVIFLLSVSINLISSTTYNLIALHVASIVLCLFFLVYSTWDEIKILRHAKINFDLISSVSKYSIPLAFGGLAFWGITSLDRLFLRGMSSFYELGIYSMGVTLAGVAMVFQTVFSLLWTPFVYKSIQETNSVNNIQESIEIAAFLVFAIWCFVGMFSWLIDLVLPSEYSTIKYLVLANVGYPLFYMLSEATKVGIGIKRKSWHSLIATILTLFFSIVLNWMLVPLMGAIGASVASVVSFMFFLMIRTELSCIVWISIKRVKIYVYSILLTSLCVYVNIFEMPYYFVPMLYGIMFVSLLFSYSNIVIRFYNFIIYRYQYR